MNNKTEARIEFIFKPRGSMSKLPRIKSLINATIVIIIADTKIIFDRNSRLVFLSANFPPK